MLRHIAVSLALIASVTFSAINFVESFYNKEAFKQIVTKDSTNDDAIYMNAQELLKRSGYNYEEYYAIADDGYITQLVRIVSPLVDRSKLKKSPIMIHHGANTDMASYLVSSSIQHHPEVFPRVFERDGPITSSNRSLAFTLANNGYDVWLVGTRGSNEANIGHTDTHEVKPNIVVKGQAGEELIGGEKLHEFSKTDDYWFYGPDDIIAHEIKNQVDKVLEVTGAKEYSVFSYSLSTPTTLAFLAQNPDYASRVKVYFQMGPAINADHFTAFDKVFHEKLCPLFPVGLNPPRGLKPFIRRLIVESSKSMILRYSLIRSFLNAMFGPSPIYQTNLERNVLAHIFQPVPFQAIQQYCQHSVLKKFERFDYGSRFDKMLYGARKPQVYKVDKIDVQSYVIISGSNDALADTTTVERLKQQIKTRTPVKHIFAAEYNHLDLIAGTEVDKYIVLPVLATLNEKYDL